MQLCLLHEGSECIGFTALISIHGNFFREGLIAQLSFITTSFLVVKLRSTCGEITALAFPIPCLIQFSFSHLGQRDLLIKRMLILPFINLTSSKDI